MATKLASRPELYTSDFYVWAEEQAALLRAGRFDALDLEHLIEEVEGLADAKRSAVLNEARVVMEHLLKLQYSPATAPRNKWRATVREHRNRLEADLTRACSRCSTTSCRAGMGSPASQPSRRYATTGSRPQPTPCPKPAPTRGTR